VIAQSSAGGAVTLSASNNIIANNGTGLAASNAVRNNGAGAASDAVGTITAIATQ
jgi:hypothetical protein